MKPFLIGIAGPSCSGKTELARALMAYIAEPVATVSLDSYYHPLDHLPLEERARRNFDHPESLDWNEIVRDVARIASGEAIEEPVYLFAEHTRSPKPRQVKPAPLVVLEGLFALHDARVREMLDVKFYMLAPDEVCFDRRKRRDVIERGRTMESVVRQYEETVRPMAEQFVVPTSRHADLVLSGVEPLESSVKAAVSFLNRARSLKTAAASA